MSDETIPREPSHAYLRANLALRAIYEHEKADPDLAELRDLEKARSDTWRLVEWAVTDPTVSDVDLLAMRAKVMPMQVRLERLRRDVNTRFDAFWTQWERKNPEPRGPDG